MRLSIFLLLATAGFISTSASAQTPTADEQALYNLITEYRASQGLPKIPLSPSLTRVAQLHVKDLEENHPDQGECNMHSWSGKGQWKAVCYTDDHKQASGMWSKPSEITSYKGSGFEISHGSSGGYTATPETALRGWKSSSGHNAVILNQGMWDDAWKAIGVGMYGGYAVVWFGREVDEAE